MTEFEYGVGGKSSRSKGLLDLVICHPELVSGSSHRKTLELTQNKIVATSNMGQMLNQVQHDKKKKVAFTLAEVLITLGIIGVVAAITLPALIENVTERKNSERHANIVYKVTQAMDIMKAHGELSGTYPSTEAFVDELQKYLKILVFT